MPAELKHLIKSMENDIRKISQDIKKQYKNMKTRGDERTSKDQPRKLCGSLGSWLMWIVENHNRVNRGEEFIRGEDHVSPDRTTPAPPTKRPTPQYSIMTIQNTRAKDKIFKSSRENKRVTCKQGAHISSFARIAPTYNCCPSIPFAQ